MEIDFNTENNLDLGFTSSVSMDENFAVGQVPSGIDQVKVDGTPLPVINKSVNIDLATPLSTKADKSQIPTKTSQLTNDSGYITNADVPTKTSQLTNDGSDGLNPFINATSYANASTGTGGTVRIGASWGTTISNTGYLGARTMTAAQYEDVGGGAVVGKTTLENVLTAKGYLSSSDVDTALSNSSTKPIQNQALYNAIVGKEIIFPVYAVEWSEPSGTNPYKTVAIVTLPAGSFTSNCTIELVIADKFNDFAKYGFVIYSAEAASQRIWLTALEKPTSTIYLTAKVYTYGN